VHELSIAMSIIEIAQQEAARHGAAEITAVHLKLGALSGVMEDALRSSYELAAYDTPLKKSELLVEHVPVKVYCPKCCAEQSLPSIQNFACPRCGETTTQVLSGKEIEVFALEITQ
jgi:hydrogenase nickel incorporation protein HypA/HybF